MNLQKLPVGFRLGPLDMRDLTRAISNRVGCIRFIVSRFFQLYCCITFIVRLDVIDSFKETIGLSIRKQRRVVYNTKIKAKEKEKEEKKDDGSEIPCPSAYRRFNIKQCIISSGE